MTASARGRHGIRRRVALLVGVGALTPMALFAWVGWSRLGALSLRLLEERQALAGSLARQVDHVLRDTLLVLASAAAPSGGDAETQAALLSALLRSRYLEGVALLAAEGGVVFEESRAGKPFGQRVRKLPAVAEVFRSGRQLVAPLDAETGPRILLAVPVRDWQGRLSRLSCAVLDPGAPQVIGLLRVSVVGSGSADLVDGEGRVVASSDFGRLARPAAPAGEEVAVSAALELAPWRLVLRQPEAEAMAPVRSLRQTLLLIGLPLLGVALLFAWGAARSVTQPLAQLGEAAERIASGNLETPVPALGEDEVGRLSRSFELMRQALQQSLEDLTQARDQLELRVKERTRQLTEILSKVVTAQEEERKRLARELHDETCQTLSALSMKLDAALAAPSSEAARERLGEAKAFAGRTLGEIHRLIYDLRPSVLDDLGLLPAIRWLGERNLVPLGIAVRCEMEEPRGRLAPQTETLLFRAVQEALQNVARHSGADSVLIQVGEQGAALEVEIEDDGRGFDPASVAQPAPSGRGLGLVGMKERLALVGGSAQIDSTPGAGTRIVLRVPLPEEESRA